jgi:hypothetical protein
MTDAGYSKSLVDPCVFSKWYNDKDFIIMSVHVDDFYVISNKEKLFDKLKKLWVEHFQEVTEKSGDVYEYLGMVVNVTPQTVSVSQPSYVEKVLETFDFHKFKHTTKPCPSPSEPKPDDDEPVSSKEYLALLGSLNYLATNTRLDILYALSVAAQKATNPTVKDLRDLYQVLKFVGSTRDYGLEFQRSDVFKLECYADASHNCHPDGKGHMGLLFRLGPEDAAFYAKSQKMKLVTLSSTETEYVVLCEATTEIVFLRQLLRDIGFPQDGPTTIYEDNMSAIEIMKGNSNHSKTKHIAPKYHYTREQYLLGTIKVVYCPTTEMLADLLTKGLSAAVHYYLASKSMRLPPNDKIKID